MEMGGGKLVGMCIEAASCSRESVEVWRRQRRTIDRLPPHLADALLRRLLHRRLVQPSLLEVFQNSVEEIVMKGESYVDTEWMAYLGAFRHLRSLNIADCRGINNNNLWHVTGMDSLKVLNLSRCSKITDAGVAHLLSISNLENLYISETGLTAAGVTPLSSLRRLRVLDMGGIPVTDSVLSSFQVLTELEHLDIWGSKVSNVGARVLVMFPKLSYLNIAWTDVTKLPNLPSITCLNMSNCDIDSIFYGCSTIKAPLSKLLIHRTVIPNAGEAFSNIESSSITFLDISLSTVTHFDFLTNMKGLEHLDLSSGKITDEQISHLAKVGSNLGFLNLGYTNITSRAICELAGNVQNLETLSLAHTAIDDEALLYIGMIPSLRMVDLSGTRIGVDICSLQALHNLSHLESLNLEETKLTDEALHPLVGLRELKCLYLKSDFLTDISLHALSHLPKLNYLGFRGAVVSNSGLFTYNPLPALGILDLRGCWLLSADNISLYCKNHPGLEVRHELILSDQNVRVGSSFLSGTKQASQTRQKGANSSQFLNRFSKATFIDERIKYSREELLRVAVLISINSPAV